MEEWKEYKLEEIGTIVGGATPSTKEPQNYDGNISWITPKDLSNYSGRYISRGERMITSEGYNSCSCKMLPKGSVLFSSRAPIGYVAIASNELCTNQGFKSVIPDGRFVDSTFLYYLLVYNKAMIEGLGSGTTFKEVSGNVMRNVVVKIPCLDTQKRISSILSSLDDKIEVNKQINDNFVIEPLFEILLIWKLTTLINDNLEQQGQTLFEEYVMNPNKPRTQLLSDYALINPVRTIAKGRAARCIDMSSLPTKGTFPNDWTFKEYNGGMKFQNGDTIMARITPCLENGKTAYINFLDDDEVAYGSTEYIVLSAQEGFCSELLYFLARHSDLISYAVAHMNGSSGRQRVSGNDIANYIMPEITKDALDVVSEKLRGIMEVIKNNSLESRRLAEIRDALLPRLMSGELKLEETNM